MMRLLPLILCLLPLGAAAENLTHDIVKNHVITGFETLATRSAELSKAAQQDCSADAHPFRDQYAAAFDAWIAVSHLRLGPTEVDDRAFALAFWPDSRGATPKTLARLIREEDPIIETPAGFSEVSIAGRGFYALEFLIFDNNISMLGKDAYRCKLMRRVAADIADLAQAIFDGWQHGYAEQMLNPTDEGVFRSDIEAQQALFKALSTGLQFTSDTRIARPMGSFERPRPKRAEAWRSSRSVHHVILSLQALQDLAQRLAAEDAQLAAHLNSAFDQSLKIAADLKDPVFAQTATPQGRLKVEVLQQSVDKIRLIVRENLGPKLGVAAGFNALDGD